MFSSRRTETPIDHVIAETAAFPLASEAAFSLALTELDPALAKSSATAIMWRHFKRDVFSRFGTFSIDEMIALRDRFWFGNVAPSLTPLDVYLGRIASAALVSTGGAATPRTNSSVFDGAPGELETPPDSRRRWRWLSFALPPHLLVATLGVDGTPLPGIELLSPLLKAQLRDCGFAQCHLHVGAAVEFPHLWISTMHAIARPDARGTMFESPGAVFEEGRGLGHWLLRAFLARFFLAGFLIDDGGGDFAAYLNGEARRRVADRVGIAAATLLRFAFDDLASGALNASRLDFGAARELYSTLTGLGSARMPDSPEAVFEADPIAPLAKSSGRIRVPPDTEFIRRALRYIRAQRADAPFHVLFWQVVRLQCLYYRHVVQRPSTPGLQWFIRFFNRLQRGKTPLSKQFLVRSALKMDGLGDGLRSHEIRTSPGTSEHQLGRMVRDFVDGARVAEEGLSDQSRDAKNIEFGIVLHLVKDRKGGAHEGLPQSFARNSTADPGPTGYRYGSIYQSCKRHGDAFAAALRTYPVLLHALRGIDVCSDELAVPNWVVLGIFRQVRVAGRNASAALLHQGGRPVAALRTTMHVGEDFVHLLTGLRNIDQAISYFHLGEGDRLGHAVALGTEPCDWAQGAGRVAMCREDRLLDLVWEWRWHAVHQTRLSAARRHFLDSEIERLSQWIFGNPHGALELARLVDDLHNPERLKEVDFPDNWVSLHQGVPDRNRLLLKYLTDVRTFQSGRAIELVDPLPETDVLCELQAGIRRQIGSLGITVEVNPSSNLLIGQIGDLLHHPLWRLSAPVGEGDAPPVAICFGSDDPITFATTIRNEFQLVYDALVSAGLSDEQARQWVDQARRNGLESRFTLPSWRRASSTNGVDL